VRACAKPIQPEDAAQPITLWICIDGGGQAPAGDQALLQSFGRALAAVELGLSNSKLEGLASKIRLINHRGYGHHSAAALIAMIYLCAGGVTVELPLY
jgi:transposase